MLVNGQEMNFNEGITVAELLTNLKINLNMVVVEVDMNIIYKDKFASTKLSSNAKVEIIQFMGGG